STAVERVFSQGRHLLHFTPNRLLHSSTRALLCHASSWLRCDLVVRDELIDVVQTLKKKQPTGREGGQANSP
ncbi:hypothetical protein PAXINDRAFT_76146, partial [Paxillus involutus ATCC 200175]